MVSNNICGRHALGTALGITLLTLVLLAGNAGAAPFGPDAVNVNFTNQKLFNISGYKNDTNGTRLPNWNITLYNATSGLFLRFNITNANGFYEFQNLAPGTYNVTEVLQNGWVNVTPISQTVTIPQAT